MENLPIYITDGKQVNEYLMKELDRFELLYSDIFSKLNSEIDPARKYLLEEMLIFHSSSQSIKESDPKANQHHIEYRNTCYPIIRRLFESFWRIYYIFDDDKEILNRWNNYTRQVKIEYSKMWRDIKEQDRKFGGFNPLLKNLPVEMLPSTEKDDPIFGSIRNVMDKCLNVHGDKLSYLYFSYRILSFYTHGNINKAILDEISPNNNNFAIIKIHEILCMMANYYNWLIGKFWSDVFKKHGWHLSDFKKVC
ncbi:MAG: hypothetical protein LBC85_05945 [Fibromonadaceae bacterium]|jgi:hypothetical protein|nr:hypothetical protein [Fibromonadaceae bacterium]